MTEFLSVLESQIGVFCDVMLKKPDKKKDRQILFEHRQSLLEQLGSCSDAALTLHLAVLCIFHHVHGTMLHASGKYVPVIIEHLDQETDLLTPEQTSLLQHHQKLVIASMNKKQDEDSLKELTDELGTTSDQVKKLVSSLKKSGSPSE